MILYSHHFPFHFNFISNLGYKYGIPEVDCCGCEIFKCMECEPIKEKQVACQRPLKCFDYTLQPNKNFHDCLEANCSAIESDAPQNEVKLE